MDQKQKESVKNFKRMESKYITKIEILSDTFQKQLASISLQNHEKIEELTQAREENRKLRMEIQKIGEQLKEAQDEILNKSQLEALYQNDDKLKEQTLFDEFKQVETGVNPIAQNNKISTQIMPRLSVKTRREIETQYRKEIESQYRKEFHEIGIKAVKYTSVS